MLVIILLNPKVSKRREYALNVVAMLVILNFFRSAHNLNQNCQSSWLIQISIVVLLVVVYSVSLSRRFTNAALNLFPFMSTGEMMNYLRYVYSSPSDLLTLADSLSRGCPLKTSLISVSRSVFRTPSKSHFFLFLNYNC